MPEDPRERRLPIWAQEQLAALRQENQRLHNQLQLDQAQVTRLEQQLQGQSAAHPVVRLRSLETNSAKVWPVAKETNGVEIKFPDRSFWVYPEVRLEPNIDQQSALSVDARFSGDVIVECNQGPVVITVEGGGRLRLTTLERREGLLSKRYYE